MRASTRIIIVSVIIAVAAGLAMLLVPVPTMWHDKPNAFTVPLAFNALMACLHMGAAALFLLSLGAYKAKLRSAYLAISAAIVLLTSGTLQLAIITGFGKWQLWWVTHGGIGVPFMLSGLAIYIGTRSLTRLIGVRSVLDRAAVVLPLVVGLSVLAALLPHLARPGQELAYDITNGVTVWASSLNLIAGLMILRLRHRIGAHYTRAMAWLAPPVLMIFGITATVFVHALFTTSYTDVVSAAQIELGLIDGILWLRAGYAFFETKDY